jgi:hypothetical protein
VSTATLQPPEFPLGAGPSTFGSTAVNTQISIPFVPANNGHITSLQVSNLSTATCTTPPVFNVIDYPAGVSSSSDTVGTPLTAPAQVARVAALLFLLRFRFLDDGACRSPPGQDITPHKAQEVGYCVQRPSDTRNAVFFPHPDPDSTMHSSRIVAFFGPLLE